jgi:hypothetical protein
VPVVCDDKLKRGEKYNEQDDWVVVYYHFHQSFNYAVTTRLDTGENLDSNTKLI